MILMQVGKEKDDFEVTKHQAYKKLTQMEKG